MKNNLSNGTKLILLHPYIQKQGGSKSLKLLALISCFTLAFLLALIYTRQSITKVTSISTSTISASFIRSSPNKLPKSVVRALVHYSSSSNNTDRMSSTDINQIWDVLKQCPHPCNFLVFGLTPETLLWKALNHNGRTVFIDENRYYAAYIEDNYPEIEVYDVQYSTKLSETKELITLVRDQAHNECRPVQNLLFSECKLGLNDLPNQLYEVDWDVMLIDGPRGYWPEAPGRTAAIFTASVLARSKKGGNSKTHVFVHDFNMKVDRVTSDEFLCKENLIKSKDMLGHFVLERLEASSTQFCRNHSSPSGVTSYS